MKSYNKIKGIKKMASNNSYDVAFKLCHTLRLYKRKICLCDDVILYPSAWTDNFFEIMFRDKNNYNDSNCRIYTDQIQSLIDIYLDKRWGLCEIESGGEQFTTTPYILKFKYLGEE